MIFSSIFFILIVLLSLFIVVVISGFYSKAFELARFNEKKRNIILLGIYWLFTFLLIGAIYLSINQDWQNVAFYKKLPAFYIPILFSIVIIASSKTLKTLTKEIPSEWLVAIQFYRIFGITYVFLPNFVDKLPLVFAAYATINNVFFGLTAPIMGRLVTNRKNYWLAILWNVAGIIGLGITPILAYLLQANAMEQFPLSLLFLYIEVPMGILIHGLSLYNLLSKMNKKAKT